MKKRLLSIVVILAMITSATTALMIPSSASNDGYRTVFSAETITVDGELDEVYKQSEKITAEHVVAGSLGTTSDSSFEAYTVATIHGIYVWAEIKDSSLNKNPWESPNHGDKFQVYLKIDNGTQSKWGWYHVDYNDRIAKGYFSADIALSTKKLADGSGWRAEMMIPFEGNLQLLNVNSLKLHVGMQANNGQLNSDKTEANYNASSDSNHTHIAYCYDTVNGSGYWNSPDKYVPLKLYINSDVPTGSPRARSAVYTSTTPQIDGTKDAIYTSFGKIALDKITACYTTVNGESVSAVESGTERTSLGEVFVAFDDNNLYIYFETNEPDASGTTKDYLQIYYRFNNGNDIVASYFCSYVDGSDTFFGATASNNGYPGTGISESSMSIASNQNGNIYSLEYRIPLPSAEITALQNGEVVDIDLAFSINDYRADGVRRYYAGDTSDSPHLWSYSNASNFPSVTLSKSITSATGPSITGASVSLGTDISVNYYALLPADSSDALMRFTMNGKAYFANAQITDKASEYKFEFNGIAPQNVADNIKAELIVNGATVATKNTYSVLENCNSLLDKYSTDAKITKLVSALINYCAAAQRYTHYNSASPVISGAIEALAVPSANDSIRKLSAQISDNLKFTSVGVHFNNANRIFVKFKASSLSGVSLTINGSSATIDAYDSANNIYIAYSDDISVLNFATKYTIRLSNGTSAQTLTYSINSYSYAMQSSNDQRMKELATATYAYGVAAAEYMNIHNSYTVISYNDGDNSTTNTAQVAEILNSYAPDFIGMQEVQEIHVHVYESLLEGNYVGIYYDHDTTNYGAPIFYNADRFEVINITVDGKTVPGTGTQWLSDTPDTISKLSDSAYIRSFVYAIFRDKITGQKLVMVNTHVDYNASANLKQIEKLLELTGKKFGDIPVFYTADWNMYRTSAGYAAMNDAGYLSSEKMAGGAHTPSTFPGGTQAIDFCFFDSEAMTAIDYKVVNDHKYSDTASDHYPVYSEFSIYPTVISGAFDGMEESLH